MANLKFTGIVTEVYEAKAGTTKKGEPWAARMFRVKEENAEYPNEVLFKRFKLGDYVKFALEQFNVSEGDRVSVEYSMVVDAYNPEYPNQVMREFKTNSLDKPKRNTPASVENEEDDNDPF
jgi:hypothetical protein